MKIFKISQKVNNDYDTFSDAIVVAKDSEDAKRIHPYLQSFKDVFYDEEKKVFKSFYARTNDECVFEDGFGTWTNDLTKIEVELIGTAKKGMKRGVICASFHAG